MKHFIQRSRNNLEQNLIKFNLIVQLSKKGLMLSTGSSSLLDSTQEIKNKSTTDVL